MKKILLLLLLNVPAFFFRAQTPTIQWAKSFGGGGNDVSNSIAIDAFGNIYTTGSFSGTVDFDPGVGVYTLTGGSSDIFVSKLDASGAFVWAQQLGGAGTGISNCIAVDAAGNVYTTGYFTNTIDFDPGAGTNNLTSTGAYDIFVSKLNTSGAFVWAKQMGGSSFDIGQSVTVDAAGNVYITGTFQGAGDYDPGAGSFVLTPAGGADVFISKLNSSGAFVWAQQFQATSTGVGNSIKTDVTGNVYISGYFSGIADFDTGPGTFLLASAGSTDIFVSKLNSSGALVWVSQMSGTLGDWSTSVAIDGAGNVYTTGRFQGTVDFDPGVATYMLSAAGSGADVFVSKLDASGNFVWAQQLGGTPDDIGNCIALDVSGNVYTTGYFSGTADFDPGAGTFNLTSVGIYDIFISKLSGATGSFVWAGQIGGIDIDVCQSLVVDAADNIYTTGYFWDTPDFDPGAGTYTLTSVGSNDVFVQKMCPSASTPSNVTTPNNQTICNGLSATLSATSSGSINWFATPTGTTIIGTGTNYITPTLTIGSYTFYAEASTCSVNPVRTAITISVTPPPVFSASTNVFVLCVGQTATLTVTGVTGATWTPGGTGTSIVVSPSVTTSYTVFGSNGGCSIAAVITQPVSPCTAIEQSATLNPYLTVYPNPFNNKITIAMEGMQEAGIYIYNALGSLIYESGTVNEKTGIDLTGQPAGIYFVKIDHNHSVKMLKIVKE